MAQGLSQSTILCAYQDQLGFLWFGTQEGLNRFDGHEFRVFRKSAENGLKDNYIQAIVEDRQQRFWLGTYHAGLVLFDPATESFTGFDLSDIAADESPVVSALHLDRNQRLWVGSELHGTWILDVSHRQVSILAHDPDLLDVVGFHEDASGAVWIGTETQGLSRASIGALADTIDSQVVNADLLAIYGIISAWNGMIWVGHDQGITVYDPQDRQISRTPVPAVRGVSAMLFDRQERLWIGTSQGLYRQLEPAADIEHFVSSSGDPQSLSENSVESLFQDRDGNIWVGTWLGGVNLVATGDDPFEIYGKPGQDTEGVQQISSVVEDRGGGIWVAAYLSAPLMRWVQERRAFEPAIEMPDPSAGTGSFARALTYDPSTNLIWMASNDGILSYFDPIQNRQVTPETQLADALQVEELRILDDRLLVATRERGVLVLDLQGLGLLHQFDDSTGLRSNYVQAVRPVGDEIWVGTLAGIARFKRDGYSFKGRLTTADGLSHNGISSLLEASDGSVWVGTEGGGLNHLNRSNGIVDNQITDSSNGLVSDSIGGILQDAQGNLWVSAGSGLSWLSREGLVRNFSSSDGLQEGGYLLGSNHRGLSGRLMFGGLGLLLVHPERFRIPSDPPRPRLTDILVLNESVAIGDERATLQRSVAYGGQPTFRRDDFLINFKFSALRFEYGSGVHYSYRIRDLDERWIATQPGQFQASYSYLDAGDYEFEVRASFDGVHWSEPTLASFSVIPPAWRSHWAYLAYLLATIVVLAIPANSHIRRVRERRQHRREIAESEQRLRLALWASEDEFWYYDVAKNEILLTYYDRHNEQFVVGKKTTREQFVERVHSDDLDVAQRQFERHLRGHSEAFEASYRRRCRDGWRWTFARGMAVKREADGEVVLMAGTSRDDHDRIIATMDLERLNEELEGKVTARTQDLERAHKRLMERERMAALGDLVSGVAHELNTPIGITLTASSYLEDQTESFFSKPQPAADDDLSRFRQALQSGLGMVRSNMRRASELIRSFKQIAVDQSTESVDNFGVSAYLNSVVSTLKPVYAALEVEVVIECPQALKISTYRSALFQIVQNLVSNSVVHGLPGIDTPRISIAVRKEADGLVLDYHDNGKGIAEEMRERIFEPFVTTARSVGRGLGMNLVYNLVTQLLQGSIECNSPDNGGVHFEIRFSNIRSPQSELSLDRQP